MGRIQRNLSKSVYNPFWKKSHVGSCFRRSLPEIPPILRRMQREPAPKSTTKTRRPYAYERHRRKLNLYENDGEVLAHPNHNDILMHNDGLVPFWRQRDEKATPAAIEFPVYVYTADGFKSMLSYLEEQKIIGVNCSNNSTTFFHDATVLLSVSTPEKCYVICPFYCIEELLVGFKRLLENKNIIKLVVGLQSHLLSFIRDFQFYPTNMIDVRELARFSEFGNNKMNIFTYAAVVFFKERTQNSEPFYFDLDSPTFKTASVSALHQRPLADVQLQFQACLSSITLKLGLKFLSQLSKKGFKNAMDSSLSTISSIDYKYKYPKIIECPENSSFIQVVDVCIPRYKDFFLSLNDWRVKISRQLDRRPSAFITFQKLVEVFLYTLHRMDDGSKDLMTMHDLLPFFPESPDPCFEKSREMLLSILILGAKRLEYIESTVCHICDLRGHIGAFCTMKTTAEARNKVYEKKPYIKDRRIESQQIADTIRSNVQAADRRPWTEWDFPLVKSTWLACLQKECRIAENGGERGYLDRGKAKVMEYCNRFHIHSDYLEVTENKTLPKYRG